MESLLVLIIGIVIGWNIPQPRWALQLQDNLVRRIRKFFDGNGPRP